MGLFFNESKMKELFRSSLYVVLAIVLFLIEMTMWPLEILQDWLQEIYDDL